MRLALVYDRVNKFGGAERILLALHEIWPEAPLYTAVYSPQNAIWASSFKIIPSFLKKLPFMQEKHELLTPLTPIAFEQFNFDKFDVVISVTSGDAKGIITKPATLHICYCLTSTRYLWSGYQDYIAQPGMGALNGIVKLLMKVFFPKLRQWDFIASRRPDFYLAISQTVADRIKTYYKKEAEIIYPPVKIRNFHLRKEKNTESYYLIVARLVPYKKIDYAISAFNKLGWPLKIIGRGIDEYRLKSLAVGNIEFISGYLTDEQLDWYYQNCRALIYPGEEDFGLTAVEAQACGKAVIAYRKGGMQEIILEGKTGEFYNTPDESALISVLKKFVKRDYLPSDCRNNANRFAALYFKKKMKKKVEDLWERFRKKR